VSFLPATSVAAAAGGVEHLGACIAAGARPAATSNARLTCLDVPGLLAMWRARMHAHLHA